MSHKFVEFKIIKQQIQRKAKGFVTLPVPCSYDLFPFGLIFYLMQSKSLLGFCTESPLPEYSLLLQNWTLLPVWIQRGDDHWVDLTAHDLWHSACVAVGLWAARVSPAASGDLCCVFSEGTAGPPAHNQCIIGSSIETDTWGTALTLRETRTFDQTSHLHAV